MRNIDLFRDYENARINSVADYKELHKENTYKYSELENNEIDGIPVCVTRDANGELEATFIPDTHLLAIGATRSGKTTGYVIPTINMLLKKKNKPSLVISDPKHELYRSNVKKFENARYKVILLDFTDYRFSDCWNPLTKFYKFYQKYLNVEDTVGYVETEDGVKNLFMGVTYDDQNELDLAIAQRRHNSESRRKGSLLG